MRRNWYGYLSSENLEEVAQAIRNLLEGRKYTFVGVSSGSSGVDVHTSNRLAPEKATHGEAVYTYRGEGGEGGGIGVIDTYGSWGVYITRNPNKRTYLSFSQEKLEISHYAPCGDQLTWVIALEEEDIDE